MLFRHDAHDLGGSPAAAAFNHDRHNGVMARHALHHVEHDVALACDGEIALRDVAKAHAAIGLFDAAPQRRVDAHDAGNVVAARHHHMPKAALIGVLAQEGVEIGIRRQDGHIFLHDLAGAAHQEHVGVQCLRHEVAAADQLDGVNVFL